MVDLAMVPWLHNVAKKEAVKDRLKTAVLIGDVIAIAAIAILTAYFINIYVSKGGFFTDKFGGVEAFFFFGAAIAGLFPPALRLVLRRRNAVRPLEAVNSTFSIASMVYLLSVFPFDFTRLVPPSLQSAFIWLTDDVARMLMTVGVLLTIFITAWTLLLYLAVKQVLEQQGAGSIK